MHADLKNRVALVTGASRGLDDITEEDFDQALAVNLKSSFLCTQAVLPGMRVSRRAFRPGALAPTIAVNGGSLFS